MALRLYIDGVEYNGKRIDINQSKNGAAFLYLDILKLSSELFGHPKFPSHPEFI